MFPLIFFIVRGQNFAVFEYVSPGHVSKCPFLIDLIRVDLTGNTDAACMYRTIASTFGRLYALYAEGVVCIFGVW